MRAIRGLAMTFVIALSAAGTAAAAADIEGVWEFSGGKVAVQPTGDAATFKGTVLTSTRLAECPHPAGEIIWLGVTPQPDGQYWGGHQFFRVGTCEPAGRGKSAFRVLRKADGKAFLRICFAPPERPELQATIAPDGTSANAPAGCRDSDLVAPADTKPPTFSTTVSLPKQGKKKCLSRRSFKIRLREPRNDALASANVYVNGKRVRTVKGPQRIKAGVNLKGLPKGRYTVKIVARTVLGRTIKGTRKYRTCAPKKKSTRKIKV